MSPNLKLQNLDQTLVLKPWLNLSFNESTNIQSKMSTQYWTGKEMRGSFHWALTEKIRATEVLILSREDIKYYLAIFYLRTKFCIYCLPLKFISILLDSTETSVTIANQLSSRGCCCYKFYSKVSLSITRTRAVFNIHLQLLQRESV